MRAKKEINIQIGEQIKAARERAKMTQESLAERIEVSPQYVSDLERGVVGVSISTLKKICLALGVSSDQILFGSTQSNDFAPVSEKCRCLSHEQFTILCEIIEKYIRAVTLTQKD
ncbi:MAG: helix-turn-helix domain-containing protein [Faecousia sp.]